MSEVTLHIAVDRSLEEVRELASPLNFVWPFYTKAVEHVPDYSEVSDGHILKPLYVGNHHMPHEAVRELASNLLATSGGLVGQVSWDHRLTGYEVLTECGGGAAPDDWEYRCRAVSESTADEVVNAYRNGSTLQICGDTCRIEEVDTHTLHFTARSVMR